MMKTFITKRTFLFFALILLFNFSTVNGQDSQVKFTHPHCGIEQATEEIFKQHPTLRNQVRDKIKALKEMPAPTKMMVDNIIPVVFHLISPCDGQFDFTKAELEVFLDDVNDDFNANNTDVYNASIDPVFFSTRGDIGLTFKLAEIDPDGNPTDGLTRSQSFYSNDGSAYQNPLKGIIQWNPSKYLNVWIVQNVATSGYAQYPWTAEAIPEIDGIVMSYDYMGENNVNNRPYILTHEIGHWLGLIHTWGDGSIDNCPNYCVCDDHVADTPNCLGKNSYVCDTPLPNSCNDGAGDLPDNIYNFMDYACEVMFTKDQKTKMLNVISSGEADRDQCVTNINDSQVFMASNSNNNDARLVTDKMVYTEDQDLAGKIIETGIIELRNCSGCSFSSNINNSFSTSGLPTDIANGISVTKLSSTTARVSFNINAANHGPNDDIDAFTIQFNSNAINGVNSTSQVFNNAAIKGIKLDFITNETPIYYSNYESGNNVVTTVNASPGDYVSAYLPVINNYVGFYTYQDAFYIFTASDLLFEAATTSSSSQNLKRLNLGEDLGTQSYKPISPGIYNGPNEITVYKANYYEDWLNQTGYAGMRITTFCGEVYYLWLRMAVTGTTLTLIDLGLNSDDGVAIDAGDLPICVPSGENVFYNWLNSVNINQINNTSGANGGYEFFTSPTTELFEGQSYNVNCQGGSSGNPVDGEWYVFVDLNGNGGYLDPGEKRYSVTGSNEAPSINTNVELVPDGTLNGVTELSTTMMIVYSMHPIYGDICKDYQYGETEEYNVTLKVQSSCDAPPANDIYIYNNCTGGTWWRTVAYVGTNHQYRYRTQGSSAWTTTAATTSRYRYIGVKPECTTFEVQMRVYCSASGTWSGWSTTKVRTSKALKNTDSGITHGVYATYGYLYSNGHTGDTKQFRYKTNVGGSYVYKTTTSHYAGMSGLTPSTAYRYQVRRKCGNSGTYSCWSATKYFTTSSSMDESVAFRGPELAAEEKLDEDDVRVFPNPIQGNFFNVVLEDQEKSINQVELVNINGQTIWSGDFENEYQVEVPVHHVPSGIYLVRINGGISKRVVR